MKWADVCGGERSSRADLRRRKLIETARMLFIQNGFHLTGIAQISPTWLSRSTFVGLLDDPPLRLVRVGIPEGWGAVGRLGVVTAVALGVAVWRMGRIRLAGATD